MNILTITPWKGLSTFIKNAFNLRNLFRLIFIISPASNTQDTNFLFFCTAKNKNKTNTTFLLLLNQEIALPATFPSTSSARPEREEKQNDFAFRVVTSANVVCTVSESSDMLKCHTGLTVNFDRICWFLMRFGRSLSSTDTFQWTRRVWKPILKTSYNIKQSNTTSETTVS